MRIFKKETETVEIPFDRYEQLIATEQKYEQTVMALQDMGYKGEYISIKDTNRVLEFLGEDVFVGVGAKE